MNEIIGNLEEIAVGDRIVYAESTLSRATQTISAEVIAIRYILGEQTYVVKTETGKRKVVGESQISKIEASN